MVYMYTYIDIDTAASLPNMGLTLQCKVVLLTLLTTALQLGAGEAICSLKMDTCMCTH